MEDLRVVPPVAFAAWANISSPTAELPKTRSGKTMRRLLRDITEGRVLGDTTTLADPTVVQSLKERYEEDAGG